MSYKNIDEVKDIFNLNIKSPYYKIILSNYKNKIWCGFDFINNGKKDEIVTTISSHLSEMIMQLTTTSSNEELENIRKLVSASFKLFTESHSDSYGSQFNKYCNMVLDERIVLEKVGGKTLQYIDNINTLQTTKYLICLIEYKKGGYRLSCVRGIHGIEIEEHISKNINDYIKYQNLINRIKALTSKSSEQDFKTTYDAISLL